MGWYSQNEGPRKSGLRVMRTGLVLFILFGAFFEMLFSAGRPQGWRDVVFPALLILFGLYLVLSRLGLFGPRKSGELEASQPTPPKPEDGGQ